MGVLDVTIGALPTVAEPIPYDDMEIRTSPDGVEILTAPEWIGITVGLLASAAPYLLSVDTVNSTVTLHGVNRTVTYRMVAAEPDGLVVICQREGDDA